MCNFKRVFKLKELSIFFLVSFSVFCLVGCSQIIKWHVEKPDNGLEEYVEEKIKDITDLDVDLTPVTGEETQSNLLQKE
jgi:ABC-type glycerol-3-phosphate transport system substrate-binding protein